MTTPSDYGINTEELDQEYEEELDEVRDAVNSTDNQTLLVLTNV